MAPRAPDGDIICHNDAAPWNTVFRDGRPIGFIDWDVAGPGTALWELGYVAWHWVRLWPDRGAREHGFEPLHERKRRLAAVAVAYGDVTSQALLAAAGERQRAWLRQLTAGVAAGIDAYRILLESGSIEGVHEDMEFVEHTRTELLDV